MNEGRNHGRRVAQIRRATRAALAAAIALLALGSLLEPAIAVDEAKKPDGAAAGAPAAPIAVPAYRQANTVAVLTIEGEIDLLTLRSIERRVSRAVRDGAGAIVLDIDTPGGRADATLDICNLLKDPSATPPNTVAWIHPQAYSAGTIISLACREIVVAPNATFGDAAPIQVVPIAGLIQMAPTERAKIEAPLLAEVIDSARRNHYDENLVQAFVSVGVELWMIENVETGERVIVDRGEYEVVFGEAPPENLTSVTPSASTSSGQRRAVAPFYQSMTRHAAEDTAEDTPSAEEIRAEIERQQDLPPSRTPLTAESRGKWRVLTQVVSDDRLLTVKAPESLFYGLSRKTIRNDDQLRRFFGAQTLIRYDRSWSESMVRVLVSFPVRIILIVIFLLALFIELAAPGVGVFGATAAIALLILVGAPYLTGLAQWWDILLVAVGILLILLEIFVIPGFGVSGLLGAGCLLVGLVGTFVSEDLRSAAGQHELGTGVASVLAGLFTASVGIWFLSRHLESFSMFRRLVLQAEVGGGPRERPVSLMQAAAPAEAGLAVGALGVAETDLRPAGRAQIDGRIVDVQSVGRYIERGSPIRVVSTGRYVIEVEEADS